YLPRQGHHDNLGVSFSYPEDMVQSVRYLGQGPFRVYKNRMRGGQLGVWEKAYNNTVTGQDWQYPEFKGYHADLYWGELETDEGSLTILSETEDLFWHLFTPEHPKMAHNTNTDAVFPQTGNLSFLHAITPIGTKFKSANRLGPQSQQNPVFYSHKPDWSYTIRLWMKAETQ
ncbi:MAG: glycoside hydrolase family 2, partial [Bacteroidota bacterium]